MGMTGRPVPRSGTGTIDWRRAGLLSLVAGDASGAAMPTWADQVTAIGRFCARGPPSVGCLL